MRARPELHILRRPLPAVLAGLWLAFLLAAVGGLGDRAVFSDGLYLLISGAASTASLLCARRRSQDRRAWTAIGLGLALWTAGDAAWTVAFPSGAAVPAPNFTDALYLSSYPLWLGGLAALLRAHTRGVSRSAWLDAVLVALALMAAAAAATFGPIAAAAGTRPEQVVASLAYPIGDLILLGFVIVAFGVSGWRPGRRWALLGGGLGALAAADILYLFVAARGGYTEGGLLDAAWLGAALLVSAATAGCGEGGAAARARDRRLVIVPLAAFAVALAIVTGAVAGAVGPAGSALALLTLALAGMRMAQAFRSVQDSAAAARRQARRDSLTALGNRRALLERLDEAIAAASTTRPWLFVLLDLDGFKGYNDAFGHPAGDRLLARLGGRLASAAPAGAAVFRLGGDEFCLLAPCPSPAGRQALVQAAARALSERGSGFTVTASAGSVLIPSEASTVSGVLGLADRRMYSHKSGGRSSARRQSRDVLMEALHEREPGLHQHLSTVADLALRVGRSLGMDPEQLDELVRAAELHDVGKVAIPEAILHKPGPLDPSEWAFMRRHTLIGERILAAAPALAPVARLVRSSHERFDGGGYPDGLAAQQIPLGARVVAVCDAYDAMISSRPYRAAMSADAALAELRRCAGTQFDPAVVSAFAAALGRGGGSATAASGAGEAPARRR